MRSKQILVRIFLTKTNFLSMNKLHKYYSHNQNRRNHKKSESNPKPRRVSSATETKTISHKAKTSNKIMISWAN